MAPRMGVQYNTRTGSVVKVKRLADLTKPPLIDYRAEFVCLIVSIKVGNPSRIFVTDFTSNPLMENGFAKDNYITDYSERIPEDQLLQLVLYSECMNPLAKEYHRLRGEELPVADLFLNILPKGLFCKISARMKTFNGILEGIVNHIEPLDIVTKKNVNSSLPIFSNLMGSIPDSYILTYLENYRYTLPEQFMKSKINNPEYIERRDTVPNSYARNSQFPSAQQLINQDPVFESSPISNRARRSPATTNPADSSFTEEQDMPQVKLSSMADLPSDNSHDRDYDVTRTPHIQVQATYFEDQGPDRKRQKTPEVRSSARKQNTPQSASPHTRTDIIPKLNKIEQTDGKVYEVRGTILEFEPLLNQLCIKYNKNSPPVLNPLSIIVGDKIKVRGPLEEDELLRITFLGNSEIYNFLGMQELEEVYIKSAEVYENFNKILKSRKIFTFKVIRRQVKINKGVFILGWEAQNLTLQGLLSQL